MSPHARPPKRAVRPAESGMALVLAMFALTTIVVASTSALLIASADIRATRNYRQASQVHFAAESAIAHALQVVNGPGVVNFQNDVVGNWGTLFGTGTRSFGPVAGYAYTVSAAADPADVVNAGRFVATASNRNWTTGPGSAWTRIWKRRRRGIHITQLCGNRWPDLSGPSLTKSSA